MEITTYREIYDKPVDTITVPNKLRGGGFEVYFMPLGQLEKETTLNKKKIGGAGDIMRAYFADVPLPDSDDNDFILPKRQVHPPLEIE